MPPKRHERTQARRSALQVLYTGELRGTSPVAVAKGDGCLQEDGPLPAYALALVQAVEAHRAAIDKYLAETSENWSLGRMPVVDRCILRLAACEVLFVDDVPTSVAINEAVELAKDFGGEDDSPRFVNGVLGRIATLVGEEAPAFEPSAPAPAAAGTAAEQSAKPAGVAAAGEAAADDAVSLADLFAAEDPAPAPVEATAPAPAEERA